MPFKSIHRKVGMKNEENSGAHGGSAPFSSGGFYRRLLIALVFLCNRYGFLSL